MITLANHELSRDLTVSLTMSTIGVIVLVVGLIVSIKKEHTVTRVIFLVLLIFFATSLVIRYNHYFSGA